jgi:ankyrin repeat protein
MSRAPTKGGTLSEPLLGKIEESNQKSAEGVRGGGGGGGGGGGYAALALIDAEDDSAILPSKAKGPDKKKSTKAKGLDKDKLEILFTYLALKTPTSDEAANNIISDNPHLLHCTVPTKLPDKLSYDKDYDVSPCYIAAREGRGDVLRNILKRDKAFAHQANLLGFTPLHAAAVNGHHEACRLLLESGANVNVPNEEGYTPLHVAAYYGYHEICRLLLAKGAKVDALHKYDYTPLNEAASRGHLEVCRLLLEKGANVNALAKDGSTPLHVAAQRGRHEVCGLLLANGANVDALTENGHTPLYMAAQRNGDPETCRLLLAFNADPEMSSGFFRRTPIFRETPRKVANQFTITVLQEPRYSLQKGT